MVTDHQVRKLMKELRKGRTLQLASVKAGMDVKTGRKYRDLGKFPSECQPDRTWRTRPDPFGWSAGGGTAGLSDGGLRPDLGRSDLTIVTTGNPADARTRLQSTLSIAKALAATPAPT